MKQMMTIITPGRRALGEAWSKVSVGYTPDGITVSREDAVAPADGKPIMALHGPDAEYANYIVEAMYEKAKSRPSSDPLTAKERYEAVNEAWFNWLEQKKLALRGVTQLGASGLHQRQRVHQNPEK